MDVFVIPAENPDGGHLLIRDPLSGVEIPPTGAWKPATPFWLRRIKDKDVLDGTKAEQERIEGERIAHEASLRGDDEAGARARAAAKSGHAAKSAPAKDVATGGAASAAKPVLAKTVPAAKRPTRPAARKTAAKSTAGGAKKPAGTHNGGQDAGTTQAGAGKPGA